MAIPQQKQNAQQTNYEAKLSGGDIYIDEGEMTTQNLQTVIEIPDDEYLVKVTNVITKSSQSGEPYIELELTIQEDPKYAGLHLKHRVFFTAKSMARRQECFRALNVKPVKDTATGKMKVPIDALKGLWMGVKVVNKPYQGTDPRYIGRKFPEVNNCFSLENMGQAAVEGDL
jgi:hypothetical protein